MAQILEFKKVPKTEVSITMSNKTFIILMIAFGLLFYVYMKATVII